MLKKLVRREKKPNYLSEINLKKKELV